MTVREAYEERRQTLLDPNKERRGYWIYALILVLVALCVFLSNRFLWSTVSVSGKSMEPTLQSGDVLIINKVKTPKIGDIIVIRAYQDGAPYVKRVYGLEGDVVGATGGKVYRKYQDENGVWQTQWFTDTFAPNGTEKFREVTVGKGQVFFLGDNRDFSEDSRSLGCKKLSDVVGVVTKFSLKHKKFLTKLFG